MEPNCCSLRTEPLAEIRGHVIGEPYGGGWTELALAVYGADEGYFAMSMKTVSEPSVALLLIVGAAIGILRFRRTHARVEPNLQFVVENLESRFEFNVSAAKGGLTLTALNDGVFVPEPGTGLMN